MPILKSAKKALRVSHRRREENVSINSRMRTAVKAFLSAPTQENLSEAFSRIDRAVKNNLLHRNTAARRKSQLSAKVTGAVAPKAAPKAKSTKSTAAKATKPAAKKTAKAKTSKKSE